MFSLEHALNEISDMAQEQVESIQRDLDGLQGKQSRKRSTAKKRKGPSSDMESKKQRVSPSARMILSEAREVEGTRLSFAYPFHG